MIQTNFKLYLRIGVIGVGAVLFFAGTSPLAAQGDCESMEKGPAKKNCWVKKVVQGDSNLAEAYLENAYMKHASLAHANLTNADLTGADLYGADLTNADLTGADLTGADLTGANLTGADLTDANLTGADLTRANLTNADLTGAGSSKTDSGNDRLTGSEGPIPKNVCPSAPGGHKLTMEEARKFRECEALREFGAKVSRGTTKGIDFELWKSRGGQVVD